MSEPIEQVGYDDHLGLPREYPEICARVIERINCAFLGTIRIGFELEFYLNHSPRACRKDRNDCIIALALTEFARFGVPSAQIFNEHGDNQFELLVQHRDTLLQQCNDLVTCKNVLCVVAIHFGSSVSFAAQPFDDKPGNSLQVSLSLHSKDGANLIDSRSGLYEGPKVVQSALEGLLRCMSESMIVFAPFRKSFDRIKKRFAHGPYRFCNAPHSASWGLNNRTAAIRVAPSDSRSHGFRLEHRVPCADANPYLTVAFILGGMAFGIDNDLFLACNESVGIAEWNCSECPILPRDRFRALEAYASGDLRPYLNKLVR